MTFSYGLQHMDTPVSVDLQKLTFINSMRVPSGELTKSDGKRERMMRETEREPKESVLSTHFDNDYNDSLKVHSQCSNF